MNKISIYIVTWDGCFLFCFLISEVFPHLFYCSLSTMQGQFSDKGDLDAPFPGHPYQLLWSCSRRHWGDIPKPAGIHNLSRMSLVCPGLCPGRSLVGILSRYRYRNPSISPHSWTKAWYAWTPPLGPATLTQPEEDNPSFPGWEPWLHI